MSVNPWRSLVRVTGFVAVALLLSGIPVGRTTSADAASGQAGPIDIEVSKTQGVGDRERASIRARAPEGVVIYELRAHLCATDGFRPVDNTHDFGFAGDRCPNVPVGGSDVETIATYTTGASSGELNFRVGAGSVTWVNDLGYTHDITCGPGSPCLLVVQAQITDDTVFYNAVICYGVGCPPEPGPAPVTSVVPAPTPEPTPPPGAASAAGVAATGEPEGIASGQGAGSAKRETPAKVEVDDGVADGTRSTSRSAELRSSEALDGEQASSTATETVSTALLSQRERVFLAALVGGFGGAWVVFVFSRSRRPRAVEA